MFNQLKSQLGQSVHTVRRFFERPVKLEGGHLTLGVAQRSVQEQARELEAERQCWYRMTDDLDALLDQRAASRAQVRHLRLVEAALRHGGFDDVQAMPVRVVIKALAELEMLVTDWSPAGLAEFRSRLAVMVKARAAELKPVEVELDVSGVAEVSEAEGVDHSVFEDMERSWAGQMPASVASALAASGR